MRQSHAISHWLRGFSRALAPLAFASIGSCASLADKTYHPIASKQFFALAVGIGFEISQGQWMKRRNLEADGVHSPELAHFLGSSAVAARGEVRLAWPSTTSTCPCHLFVLFTYKGSEGPVLGGEHPNRRVEPPCLTWFPSAHSQVVQLSLWRSSRERAAEIALDHLGFCPKLFVTAWQSSTSPGC